MQQVQGIYTHRTTKKIIGIQDNTTIRQIKRIYGLDNYKNKSDTEQLINYAAASTINEINTKTTKYVQN